MRRGVRHVVIRVATGVGCVAFGLLALLRFVDLPGDVAFPFVVGTLVVCGALFLGSVALCAYDVVGNERQRREHMAFAELHGWRFFNRSNEFTGRFTLFPFDGRAEDYQLNIVRGEFAGAQCAAFTYVRVVQSEEGGEVLEPYQVVLAELPVFLPRLELVPERIAHKIAATLTGDLDVESDDFNRSWRVICDDRRYAHAVLHPRMIERLLESDARRHSILIEGGAVLMWRPGRRSTRSLASRLAVLSAVARRIPEHVVREYREPGPGKPRALGERHLITPLGEARAPRLAAFDIFDAGSYR